MLWILYVLQRIKACHVSVTSTISIQIRNWIASIQRTIQNNIVSKETSVFLEWFSFPPNRKTFLWQESNLAPGKHLFQKHRNKSWINFRSGSMTCKTNKNKNKKETICPLIRIQPLQAKLRPTKERAKLELSIHLYPNCSCCSWVLTRHRSAELETNPCPFNWSHELKSPLTTLQPNHDWLILMN